MPPLAGRGLAEAGALRAEALLESTLLLPRSKCRSWHSELSRHVPDPLCVAYCSQCLTETQARGRAAHPTLVTGLPRTCVGQHQLTSLFVSVRRAERHQLPVAHVQ